MPLDATALSSRIARARSEAGLTQAELARGAGLGRTVIAKIETSARSVSALELARIAQTLGQRIDWLMTDGPATVVSYRARRDDDGSLDPIDRELERLARDVEFLLAQESTLSLPRREPWRRPRSVADADALAKRIRTELALGDSPVTGMAEVLSSLGLLIFVADLGPSAADGGTVLLDRGGVALLNGSAQLGRRRLTAAHELAHFLVADPYSVDRDAVDRPVTGGAGAQRTEALFDRFARAFLLPEGGLAAYWRSALADGPRAAAVRTASAFQVDMSTLARRLAETGLVGQDDAERIRRVRTTQADILDHHLLVPVELESRSLPADYERAVLTLFRGERISGERALDLLRGKYEPDDLPALDPPRESELWSILS